MKPSNIEKALRRAAKSVSIEYWSYDNQFGSKGLPHVEANECIACIEQAILNDRIKTRNEKHPNALWTPIKSVKLKYIYHT